MSRRRLAGTFALCVILIGDLSPAGAATASSPGARCAAAKLKAAAKKEAAKLACQRRALLKSRPVDPACLAKAEAHFTLAFTTAESAGGCVTSRDAAVVEQAVDSCVGVLTGLLPAVSTTTTVTTTSATTTTAPSLTCSPVGGSCGSCGNGYCFAPFGASPPFGVCVDATVQNGPECTIDPPSGCPPGMICVITSVIPPVTAQCALGCY